MSFEYSKLAASSCKTSNTASTCKHNKALQPTATAPFATLSSLAPRLSSVVLSQRAAERVLEGVKMLAVEMNSVFSAFEKVCEILGVQNRPHPCGGLVADTSGENEALALEGLLRREGVPAHSHKNGAVTLTHGAYYGTGE